MRIRCTGLASSTTARERATRAEGGARHATRECCVLLEPGARCGDGRFDGRQPLALLRRILRE
jgi:hypothetical protein